MEKDLLSIPEFAGAVGKKKQGIYEQVKNTNSKLYQFVVFQGNKAYIKREALIEVYGIDKANSQESQARSQEPSQESQAGSQESQARSQESSQESQAGSQAQDIIIFLQNQIIEKDKQIAEKDRQIEKIQQLLDQEQQLHARTNLLLAEYQDKEKQEEEINAETMKEEPQKKRSWLYRFFIGE